MFPKTLYIVANGFDQHHSIPSGYDDLRIWLKKTNPFLYDEVSGAFGNLDYEKWSDFEESLTSFEALEFVEEILRDNYPNPASDDFRDRDWHAAEIMAEGELEDLFKRIRKAFVFWALNLEKGDAKKKIRLNTKDAFFLTFNYTSTLETLYQIPSEQILHIHGHAQTPEDWDALVLGHGKDYEDVKKDLNINVEYGEYSFVEDNVSNTTVSIVANQRKPVEEIIALHETQFERFKDVNEVNVFGFSWSDIDLPYIEKISRVIDTNAVQWNVSYRSEHKKDKYKNKLHALGIPIENIKMIKLIDLLESRETSKVQIPQLLKI